MGELDQLKELKSVARKLARARGIKHIGALDVVAQHLAFSRWNALTAGHKKGWQLTSALLARARACVEDALPGLLESDIELFDAESPSGEIQGYAYQVDIAADDVFVWGRGWELVLPEAPLAPPQFRVTDRRLKANPIGDESFRRDALAVGTRWRKRVHASIAADWPRRSTVPDSAGRAEHPLGHGVSDTWWCMHCDQSFTGKQVAANLFHCPNCLATPLDLHTSPWWLEQLDQSA